MIDLDALVAGVMVQLGLTAPQDKIRVQNAANLSVDHILTYCDWSFLSVTTTVDVTSASNVIRLKDDFLYPIIGSMKSSFGPIEIVSRSWLNTNFPDLTNLIGNPKYCVFEGVRTAMLYPVGAITGTLDIEYQYQRRGTIADLDIDPAFELIVRDGVLRHVAKLGTFEQLEAEKRYYGELKLKATIYQRMFFGTATFYPSKLSQGLTAERKAQNWEDT